MTPLRWVVLLVVLKAIASAISIGSGFRGGLFFASLFLGALLGKAFAGVLALVSTDACDPAGGLRAGRHERPGGGDHRRAADHGVPGAGGDRQPADDGGGAGRLRGLRR